jgi:hypothetical protein
MRTRGTICRAVLALTAALGVLPMAALSRHRAGSDGRCVCVRLADDFDNVS